MKRNDYYSLEDLREAMYVVMASKSIERYHPDFCGDNHGNPLIDDHKNDEEVEDEKPCVDHSIFYEETVEEDPWFDHPIYDDDVSHTSEFVNILDLDANEFVDDVIDNTSGDLSVDDNDFSVYDESDVKECVDDDSSSFCNVEDDYVHDLILPIYDDYGVMDDGYEDGLFFLVFDNCGDMENGKDEGVGNDDDISLPGYDGNIPKEIFEACIGPKTEEIVVNDTGQDKNYNYLFFLYQMDTSASKDHASKLSSPLCSPNVSALLKIKIISWSQETGLPASVCVRVANRIFNLHKYPLFSKSGYFNRELSESNEVELPQDFPGGPETFEMISLFIYGSSTLVDPINVTALRCAAEYLEMTEEYSSGNLCERFDIYLNQVVLQSWDNTLIVLQRCQSLDPWAEELLIVSRCIESLAFMACMEILDPERRRDQPVVNLEALSTQRWSSEMVQEIMSQDVWIKDLIALPFGFFKRVIGSLRRQGMKEKYVSPVILFYANWVLSVEKNSNEDVALLLKEVLDLLQMGDKGSRVIPVGFYFNLLSRSLKFNLDKEYTIRLQNQISGMLHMSAVSNFISAFTKSMGSHLASYFAILFGPLMKWMKGSRITCKMKFSGDYVVPFIMSNLLLFHLDDYVRAKLEDKFLQRRGE